MATEELKVLISTEADTSGAEKAKDAIQELGDESEKAKGKVSKFFTDNIKDMDGFKNGIQKAGEISTNFLKVTAGAFAGVTTAFLALGPATEEYRTAMAKLDTAFQSAGSNAEVAKTTYNDLYRVLGDTDQATEAANHLAQLTTEEKALNEWTDICQGVFATFGDSLPIESLTEAANETAKVGDLTGALADALNWAGINEEDFQAKLDACNTEAEREALIRETLSGLYDDAAKSYEKNAAGILAQNEAQAKMTEAMAELGKVAEPVVAMLAELGAEILADLTPHIKDFAEKHMPKIKDALKDVGDKIGKVINFIADNWQIISIIGATVLAIATAISVLSAGLTAYNTVMAITSVVSAPIIGIIAAIVAGIALLVAGIVLAVKHWDEITEAIKNFATKVGEFFSGLWDTLTEWIGDIGESISKWWDDTMQGFSDWWGNIQEGWSNFWSGVGDKISGGVQKAKDKFEEMKKNLSEKMTNIHNDVTEKFENIKNKITEKTQKAKEEATNKFQEMKQNIGSKLSEAHNTVSEKFENIRSKVAEKAKGALDTVTTNFNSIKSTISSKVSEAYNTVSGKFTDIKNKITSTIEGARDTVKNAIEKMKSFFNFKWELPKIKLPKISVTGKFSLDPPQVPKFSISWNALGGVFDSATIARYGNSLQGLGEDGAEAIVPLEKNTYWLDRIATMLAEKQGSKPIVLQVDGKVFAQTAINTMNDLTKQTGSLALNIV